LGILIDAFEWTKAGRGQVVSIMSEAGVGKSRLLYEFRKAVANEDVTFLEGHCLSYSRGVAYQPVIDILKANFNINETDGDSEIREKVQKGLKLLGADEASTEPFLLELLSVKESGVDEFPMSPEAIKDGGAFLKEDINKLSIPSTIQDVIMARVDSLPDDAKNTLQIGSAIEREFSFNLIKQVASLSEDQLLSNLSILKDSELLYERGIYPQSTYIFKHALTREVVYDSILTSRKKKLHEQIGDAFETLHEDNIIEHYGILAGHYILSDNYEKGAKYSSLAGRQAQKRSSYTDAISYAKKGIACLEMMPQTDDIQRRIIDDRTALSNYCMGLNYHHEGMKAVAPIVDLAQKINYKNLASWQAEGKIQYRIDVIDGLENAPRGINKLFDGSNKGKLIVKVSEGPSF
jgi:predicted ATPase